MRIFISIIFPLIFAALSYAGPRTLLRPLEMRHLRNDIPSRMITTIELLDSSRPLRVAITASRSGVVTLQFDLLRADEGRRFINLQTPQSPALGKAVVMALRAAFEVIDSDLGITHLDIKMNPQAMKEIRKTLLLPQEFPAIRDPRSVPTRGLYPLAYGTGGAVVGMITGGVVQQLFRSGELPTTIGLYTFFGLVLGAAVGFTVRSIGNAHDFRKFGAYLTQIEVDGTIRDRIRRVLAKGDAGNVLWVLNPCEASAL